MAPDTERASPPRGLARQVIAPAKRSDAFKLARAQSDELAARRELRSWQRAAEYLNALGYPAAVPPALIVPLRQRGLSVWAASAA